MRTDLAHRIDYLASQHVRDTVLSLGRTEDIRFSPSNRRLAVAGFDSNKITIFEVSITTSQKSKNITLTGVTDIASSYLNRPHGLDFIDDERILVANREGQVCIFELPPDQMGSFELAPVAILSSDDIATPGSVAVIRNEQGLLEALICNNYVNSVTRHLLNLTAGCITSKVLLKKWLDIPDGISVSKEQRWIAVSTHGAHAVLLYENKTSLNELSRPDGILRRTTYPHGVRFTSDGHFIVVADGGSPFVNIYEKMSSDWRGVRNPLLSFRVLHNEDYLHGRHNPGEGGPKGIDLHDAHNILVTTCERQPLAFFDLRAILEERRARIYLIARKKLTYNLNHFLPESWIRKRKGLEVSCQLNLWRIERGARRHIFRIRRVLRAMSHHSFIRVGLFLVMGYAQRRIGVDSFGDRLQLFAENQNFAPIAKEIPPDPINGEEISRVIFQTWKSRTNIPPNYRYWRSTFIRKNPDFQCVLWDDDDNRAFIAEKFAWFLPTYDRLPAEIFRADAIRPFFLFFYGGVYADMDTECLRPLHKLTRSGDVILGQMGTDPNDERSIPNAIMASKPFQLFWLLVIALMIEKWEFYGRNKKSVGKVWPELVTGPIVLHSAFNFYRSESEQNIRVRARAVIENLPKQISAQVRAGGIELLPPDTWYPINWRNPFHNRLRTSILDHGVLPSPTQACSLFPKADVVTYWSHSWEPVDESRKQFRRTATSG
jgi:inositol phosphorylceramide mannosyltransferase catalytic subunit